MWGAKRETRGCVRGPTACEKTLMLKTRGNICRSEARAQRDSFASERSKDTALNPVGDKVEKMGTGGGRSILCGVNKKLLFSR